MEKLKLTINLQSPLCVTDRRTAGQFRESAGFVAGSTLRGAVAELMLSDGHRSRGARTVSNEFRDLFLGERSAIFGNANPANNVLPATAMSCKAFPGFRNDHGDNHGVIDTLIKRLCVESLRPAGMLYLPKCRFKSCGMRLERYPGIYRASSGRYISEQVTHRLLTRVAINRRRATAEDQLLYSPIVISEGSVKMSRVPGKRKIERGYKQTMLESQIVVESHAEVLKGYLEQLDHVGSGASRGLGLVETTVETISAENDLARVRERRERLNREIKQRWDELMQWRGCGEPLHSPNAGSYFTIDLYSDAILKEHGLLPMNVLTTEMLWERCGVEDDSLRLVRAYSSYDYRGGWNSAQGLPKDVEVITPLGGVFVFFTTQPEKWDAPLLELETWGIGERTAEGFGQVRICDQFHLNYEEVV